VSEVSVVEEGIVFCLGDDFLKNEVRRSSWN